VEELYDVLRRVDIAAARKPDYYKRKPTQALKDVPQSFPEFNTGVILFRKSKKIINLFSKWSEFDEDRFPHDQPSFRKALYRQKSVKYHTLDERWNCRFTIPGSITGKAHIFHGRPWNKSLSGKKEKLELWSPYYVKIIKKIAKKINSTDLPRCHIMGEGGMVKVYPEKRYTYKVRSNVEAPSLYDGVREAVRRKGLLGSVLWAFGDGCSRVYNYVMSRF
jgi:hypothetical protein